MAINATGNRSYGVNKLIANSEAIPLMYWIINQVDAPVAPILNKENNYIHSDLLQPFRGNAHQINGVHQ